MLESALLPERLQKKRWTILILWMCMAVLSRYIKMGFMFGSHEARFTGMSIVFPIVGYLFSSRLACTSVGCAWICAHLLVPIPVTAGIPTFCAVLSWLVSKTEKKMQFLFHVGLPTLCILIFCNTCPFKGWAFSLFWTVPIALHFLPSNLFFRALQSTFTAHAVGSVIWAFRIPMSGEQWVALIPVVALERLLYALLSIGMIGFFFIVNACLLKEPMHYIQQRFYKFNK